MSEHIPVARIQVKPSTISFVADEIFNRFAEQGATLDPVFQQISFVLHEVLTEVLDATDFLGFVQSDGTSPSECYFKPEAKSEGSSYLRPQLLGSVSMKGWDIDETPTFAKLYDVFQMVVTDITEKSPDPNCSLWFVGELGQFEQLKNDMAEIRSYEQTNASAS